MRYRDTEGKAREENPVFKTLMQFYGYLLDTREIEKAADMLDENIFFLGTMEDVFGRKEFIKLMSEELKYSEKNIPFRIIDYREKRREQEMWDCCFRIEIVARRIIQSDDIYVAKVSACIVKNESNYKISILHSTLLEGGLQKEDRFPFRIISNQMGDMDLISKRTIWNIICETMPNGIIGGYCEKDYPIYMINDRLLEFLGYTYEEFMELTEGNALNRVWNEDREEVHAVIEKECQRCGEYEVEYRMKKKDGNFLWVYDKGRCILTQDGRKAVISLVVDISETVRIKNHLFVESVTDPLTGLYNRRGGEVMITQKINGEKPYIFLMMDIDNFKAVNDIYGHHEGDIVLKYISDQLKHFFRSDDVIIRLGGDEFVIFVHPCTSIEAIGKKVEKISLIYKEMIEQEYPLSHSSLSYGGVFCECASSFVELYKKADQILYEVKHECKGQFRIVTMDKK